MFEFILVFNIVFNNVRIYHRLQHRLQNLNSNSLLILHFDMKREIDIIDLTSSDEDESPPQRLRTWSPTDDLISYLDLPDYQPSLLDIWLDNADLETQESESESARINAASTLFFMRFFPGEQLHWKRVYDVVMNELRMPNFNEFFV